MDPLATERGWSNSDVAGWVTCFFLGGTLSAPLTRRLADRVGARPIIPTFAFSIAGLSLMRDRPWLLYALGIASGVAGSSLVNGTGGQK